ncbi:uncharacterized protein METZ01_LOCUS483279, partial [marine metagenome]
RPRRRHPPRWRRAGRSRPLDRQLQGRPGGHQLLADRALMAHGARHRPGRHRGRLRPPRRRRRRSGGGQRMGHRRGDLGRFRPAGPCPGGLDRARTRRLHHRAGHGHRHSRLHGHALRARPRGTSRDPRQRTRPGDRCRRRCGQYRDRPAGRTRLRGPRLDRTTRRGRLPDRTRSDDDRRSQRAVRTLDPSAGAGTLGRSRRCRREPHARQRARRHRTRGLRRRLRPGPGNGPVDLGGAVHP